MKLTRILHMHMRMLFIKNDIDIFNVSGTWSWKRFQVHYGLWLKLTESVFFGNFFFFCYCIQSDYSNGSRVLKVKIEISLNLWKVGYFKTDYLTKRLFMQLFFACLEWETISANLWKKKRQKKSVKKNTIVTKNKLPSKGFIFIWLHVLRVIC